MYKREPDQSWDFKNVNTTNLNHGYHTYPARMIPQIAAKIIDEFAPPETKFMFDPYMGSATTLVEASVRGIKAAGTDLNPLARLIASVKTRAFDKKKIDESFLFLNKREYDESKYYEYDSSHITNISHWYSDKVLNMLKFLHLCIEELDSEIKDFFILPFSETIRECSYTRNGDYKRYKMDEETIARFNPDVIYLFLSKCKRNIEFLENVIRRNVSFDVNIYDFNTVNGFPDEIQDESVDMVVTSPPYGDSRTTVGYGEFSSWSGQWLKLKGFETVSFGKQLMGGKVMKEETKSVCLEKELNQIREKSEKRYYEVCSFLNEYRKSLSNISAKVKKGGRACYVVGNRRVRDIEIPLDYYTCEIFEENNFKHFNTMVRNIPSKRMKGSMDKEYIVIMDKITV